MAKVPRPHQAAAIKALQDYDYRGNPLVVVPVGGGKTLIAAEFIRWACTSFPGTRILVLCHVTELISQIAETLFGQWPEARTSFYAAKLGKKDLSGDIIFATIQSFFRHAFDLYKPIDLVIIDESHLVSPKQNTAYQKLLDDLRVVNPNLKVIGLTGTPYRATEGTLTEGEGRIFSEIIYQVPMLYLIEKSFLCPPITPKTKTQMSTEGVAMRNGDFVEGQLQAAVDKDEITSACVTEIIEHGLTRKKWIVFTAGMEHCRHVRDEFRSRGVVCEMITGKTETRERARILADYKADRIKCLVNVACLTTGVDVPAIDLLAIMRPIRSPVLFTQVCGRAIRISPGKTNALILDFGGAFDHLGPLDMLDVKKAGKGTGDAPVKVCPGPDCHAVCFASTRLCPDCGYQFPIPDPFKELMKRATSAPALSIQVEPEWLSVIGMTKWRHEKEGKPPSMKVIYHCVGQKVPIWLGFEHPPGKFNSRALAWHKLHNPYWKAPTTVDAALEMEHRQPKRILVLLQKDKLPEILEYEFGSPGDEPETVPTPPAGANIGSAWGVDIDEDEIPF